MQACMDCRRAFSDSNKEPTKSADDNLEEVLSPESAGKVIVDGENITCEKVAGTMGTSKHNTVVADDRVCVAGITTSQEEENEADMHVSPALKTFIQAPSARRRFSRPRPFAHFSKLVSRFSAFSRPSSSSAY